MSFKPNALMNSLRRLLSHLIQILLPQRWFPNDILTKLNASVLANIKIIDTIISSVQESETRSSFINGKYSVPLRNNLHKMGHIQGPTPN